VVMLRREPATTACRRPRLHCIAQQLTRRDVRGDGVLAVVCGVGTHHPASTGDGVTHHLAWLADGTVTLTNDTGSSTTTPATASASLKPTDPALLVVAGDDLLDDGVV